MSGGFSQALPPGAGQLRSAHLSGIMAMMRIWNLLTCMLTFLALLEETPIALLEGAERIRAGSVPMKGVSRHA